VGGRGVGHPPLSFCSGGTAPATTATILRVFSENVILVRLILTIPASVPSAERSFSALRRLKTYLRNNITEERLTHLLILHIHRAEAATIDMKLVCKELVAFSSERGTTFGNFV